MDELAWITMDGLPELRKAAKTQKRTIHKAYKM